MNADVGDLGRELTVLLFAGIILVAANAVAWAVRDYGGWYTAERLQSVRANCDKYEWAQEERERHVRAAQVYVELSDDYLWKLLPGNELPRSLHVCYPRGEGNYCPKCGMAIHRYGHYPWKWNHHLEHPWKVICSNCEAVFPTNDFEKYLESCIDETGVFSPERGDRSLLYNSEHPDPNDPLHMYGVDDGYGWTDTDGKKYQFVAYYSHWMQLSVPRSILDILSQAYVYTGDARYAHKALVLMDRLADLYPTYQGGYASGGYGAAGGKITDYVWECGLLRSVAVSVDRVVSGTADAPELYEFLAGKGRQYQLPHPKGSRELLMQNIDDGILREGARAVMERDIMGNQGMHQSSITACALALNTNPETEQWLDWLFQSRPADRPSPEGSPTFDGGFIPGLIIGSIDRDGVGAECAPSYSLGWGSTFGAIADWLAEYDGYTKHDIYRDLPPFKATVTAPWRLLVLGYTTPNIGDSGGCGSIGKVGVSAGTMARRYRYTRDPMAALAAYYANGESAEGLGRDIFQADPDATSKEIAEIARQYEGEENPFIGGSNRAGYRMASVEYGWGRDGTALWMYYGDTAGGNHGHRDRLNFDIMYRGICMLPDHGYPEQTGTWPQRLHCTRNTIFHNTVVVNQMQQIHEQKGGYPELFCQLEDFGAVRVDSPQVYAGVDKYQRTMAFIKLDEERAYAFDVFRVRGGDDHVYSLHGPPGTVTHSGLNLVAQQGGTYAGPDAPFRDESLEASMRMFGYPWLCNVERDVHPPMSFWVDWKAQAGYRGVTEEDDIHLRFWTANQYDDVALADAQPPQHLQDNPEWLRYLLTHRTGENLDSTFTGILEPYSGQPSIVSVERLRVISEPEDAATVCLKVTLADGTVDWLVASDSDDEVSQADGGPQFAGAVGWLRVRDGRVQTAVLSRGTRLALDGFSLSLPEAGYHGTIAKMHRELSGDGLVWVDTPLPVGDVLAGQQMIIENDRYRNATYTIQSVEVDGDLYRVHLGDVTFVRDFQDPNDYDGGFVYNFEEGADFIIPNVVRAHAGADGTYELQSTCEVDLTAPDV